jgi:hypothetical protein
MLALLGDVRVESVGRALRASASPAEAEYLDRLLAPPRELVTCALNVVHEAQRWRAEACAFNRSERAAAALGLRLAAFDAPFDRLRAGTRAPSLVAEHTARLPVALAAQSGQRIELSASLSLAGSRVPRAFELDVERAEVLP